MPHRTVSRKIQSPLRREDFQRITGQTNKDCSFSELYFDKFPTPTTFACWKIRFKTEVCTCSPFPTEAMLWIKEVEMVDSVDDLKSSRSIRRTLGPDFELLDARIASEQNHPEYPLWRKKSVWRKWKLSKKTVSFEGDRSLTWSTNTSGSLVPTILSRIMQTYLQLFFELTIFRNSIRNGTKIYGRWHKSHLMTSWKACTNWESESLRNSRPYWNCTIWRFIRRRLDLIITDWRQW